MCSNLIARGEKPMCVQACVGYARFFGDLDDPELLRCQAPCRARVGAAASRARELTVGVLPQVASLACPTRLMDPSPPPSAKGPFRGWRLAVAPNAIKATSAPGSARFRWRA